MTASARTDLPSVERRAVEDVALDQAVAIVALLLLGARQFLWNGLTSGYAVAVVLAPVWLPVLRRYWGGRWLVGVTVVAVGAGMLLTDLAAADHAVSTGSMVATSILVLGAVCGVGVILWAREVLPGWAVGLAFGMGLAFAELTSDGPTSANPWKYAYAVPLALVLLSLLRRRAGHALEIATLVGLAAVSAVQDSRSYFATFLLAAVLLAWSARPARTSRRAGGFGVLAMLGLLAVVFYNLGTALLVEGVLGEETRARSVAQIEASGSVVVGGRPEIGATIALVGHRPWGFGSGTSVNLADLRVAKSGMATVGYAPNNGYVENYLFGNGIKLHSITGELWAWFGVAGVFLAATLLVLIARGLAMPIARRQANALTIYLCCAALWNLAFSPVYGATPTLILTLGLALTRRPDPQIPHDDA